MISSEPANSADRAQEFVLYGVDQGDRHLVGTWSYTNGAVGNKTPPRVEIEGTRTTDGVFWPDVKLEARKGPTGKWKLVPNPSIEGERATVTIEPNAINFDLTVNLDAFKPLIGKYEDGRIVLTTGRASVFELKDLSPPEPEVEQKNDSTKPAQTAPQSNADLNAPAQDMRPPRAGVTSIPARTVALVSSTAEARLRSSISDFLSLWGSPSEEESLTRTANFKWTGLTANGKAIVPGVFAVEVAFLDGVACEIALRSNQRITSRKLAKLTKPFLTTLRHADFDKPKSDLNGFRTYELSEGNVVLVNKHERHNVIVIMDECYLRNQDVFDGEAAKVRPPSPNH